MSWDSRALMKYDFKSNSSPYNQKRSSQNSISKNYFFWKFAEDFSKKRNFLAKNSYFSIKSSPRK